MKSSVVVGYDQTPPSERALAEAAREAAWRGATLTVVNAFNWMPPTTPMTYVPASVEESLRESSVKVAEHGAGLARAAHPGLTVDGRSVSGGAAEALATVSRGADLLVVGNRGRGGFTGLLLGSVSMRAVSESCCPVMVVRGAEHEPHHLIVAAVDIEEPSDEILEFAFAEADRRGARLSVVHVWDGAWAVEYYGSSAEVREAADKATADIDAYLEAAVHTWRAKYPDVHAEHRVADGTPGAVLTEASHHADLVIAGARRYGDGRHGMRVGPVTHTLLHHAECPVAVVPRGEAHS